MAQSVQAVLKALFATPQPTGKRLMFHWRLIKRHGKPFLLLPENSASARVHMELYSAQRRRARIWRAVLPMLIQSPASQFFPRVSLEVDADSEIVRFLAAQSGVAAEDLSAPAIKFGGLGLQKSRLALLLCDATDRPVKVLKLGLNEEGRAATDREAEMLEQLPPEVIGCIRMSGRLRTEKISAFATPYFPGESPENDAGLEQLFHSWLRAGEPVALESLSSWKELEQQVATAEPAAWQKLRTALAGKKIRPTLQHGDFAPWNIRAINTQNLQAFDWERGHLQGIPGWDWFHFIIQTAILARRLSVERVAVEVEELLRSPRFRRYAAAAGIESFVQPLVLAYHLHHCYVIQPLEGGATTKSLFELLARRWNLAAPAPVQNQVTRPGLWADAAAQLQSTVAQLNNLFWEPTLNSKVRTPMLTQFWTSWPIILTGFFLLMAIAGTHYVSPAYLIFLPFHLVPISLVTWRTDRRWGAVMAAIAAVVGPVVQSYKDVSYHSAEVVLWNVVVRYLMLHMCVLFVDRIRVQKDILRRPFEFKPAAARLGENWAVLLVCAVGFGVIFVLDYITNPRWNFIPIYLLPCMVLALRLNFHWGIASAMLAAFLGSLTEYLLNSNYHPFEIFGWNCFMRFLISSLVILLLERIRHENVLLFSPREPRPVRS